jgi:hypothetical protein
MTKSAETSLLKLLKQRRNAAGPRAKGYDAAEVVAEWRSAVADLIAKIEGWLADAKSENLVVMTRELAWLHEAQLGQYQVTLLTVQLPGQQVLTVRPVARFVLGAEGRVDVTVGPRSAMLVRDKGGRWLLARQTPPALRPIALTERVFNSVVVELLEGR